VNWVLDAVRLGPDDDGALVAAAQVRDVITRLIGAGHWQGGDEWAQAAALPASAAHQHLLRWAGSKYRRLRSYKRFTAWWSGILDSD
jgi:hypothetical protein